jgi:hypothetical protein
MNEICSKDLEVKCVFSIGTHRLNMILRFQKGDRLDELIDHSMTIYRIPHYLEQTLKQSIRALIQQQEQRLSEKEAGNILNLA